ncbi:uncharacterized protein LOC18448436 isoform X2 [Amborella trichopoda]|uniref:FAD-binding domain-containing protein n=1 Tax=Amborella trichopoda TaxID=13333 RepID=U5D376_AMBTC|nr:uncharacterized protein LOC18448436 isoform X2 [Amborella trichopoda]ERN20026.1 hypothetical protein AMTR_s00071p00171840 [Amborella trichopoda]|eukprot:XP_006858559.1 uncharacterized protein LOC18448436 isoform X2 [Amborella trichopoda]
MVAEGSPNEGIVIVGGGIAGLATALGLHRMGLKSQILESHDSLRTTGFAFTMGTNAWRALETLGVVDSLRQQHVRLQRVSTTSTVSGATTHVPLTGRGNFGEYEARCLRRDLMVEGLARELPRGCIRFGAKVVGIERKHNGSLLYHLHLADGTTVKAKVVIGCDGVNSVVAKWLGLPKPGFVGRTAARGLAHFSDGHDFEPDLQQYFGDGFRLGFVPCDDKTIYWFFTWYPSHREREIEDDAEKIKEVILKKIRGVPKEAQNVIERTKTNCLIASRLRCMWPWNLIWRSICRGAVCVAGDAFHAMTPEIRQGGCSALEDGVILARCLGEALLERENHELEREKAKEEEERIHKALVKYGRERRWRAIELITTAYVLGFIQQSRGRVMTFVRDTLLSKLMGRMLLRCSDFDCGKLYVSNP